MSVNAVSSLHAWLVNGGVADVCTPMSDTVWSQIISGQILLYMKLFSSEIIDSLPVHTEKSIKYIAIEIMFVHVCSCVKASVYAQAYSSMSVCL